jgi:hypothetical protein
MKKAFIGLLAAGTIAAGVMSASAPAQAYHRHGHIGAAVAAGVVGGLVVGTAIGAAAYPAYRPAPGYVVYTGYSAGYPVACPGGYWARKPVAFDRAGRPVAWSKPRFICP